MKAKDLMIGDWVQDLSPVVIDAISNEDICTYQCKDGYITDNPRNLKPIPLTPEILEKNGWKHKYYGIYRQTIGETITIDIFPEGCSVEDERGSQCLYRLRYHLPALKFVHELQHALRLCGIEKEIKL